MSPTAAEEWELTLAGPARTAALGRAFGERAPEGAVLLLEGPLGAGKTTFAQGVAEGCGVSGPVTSPTYNLILRYAGRRPFTHVDLFRLADEAELETLGLDEILGAEGVACVEWPALVRDRVAPPRASVRLSMTGDAEVRRASGRLEGAGWGSLLERLAAGVGR